MVEETESRIRRATKQLGRIRDRWSLIDGGDGVEFRDGTIIEYPLDKPPEVPQMGKKFDPGVKSNIIEPKIKLLQALRFRLKRTK